MPKNLRFQTILLVIVLLSLLLSAGCTAAAPAPVEPTAVQAVEAAPTDVPPPTAVPATATAAPTQTPVPPTETPLPTATATLVPTLGAAQDGLSAWCLPEGAALTSAAAPFTPPAGAKIGTLEDGVVQIRSLPVQACVFMYTFNQPAPTGLKLQLFDQSTGGAWLTADLTPVDGKPESAAAVLTHTYVVAPPLWRVNYTFVVVDASGSELRRDKVTLNRWVPKNCWTNLPPNPVTLTCPLPQDQHPWDPFYLTPMPTGEPE